MADDTSRELFARTFPGDGFGMWESGCPVFVSGLSAKRNKATQQASAEIIIKNISDKTIDTIRFRAVIIFHDGEARAYEASLLDQDLLSKKTITAKLPDLGNPEPESIRVEVLEVSGSGIIWTTLEGSKEVEPPKMLGLAPELREERLLLLKQGGCTCADACGDAQAVFANTWWQCVCGQVNVCADACCTCGVQKSTLSAINDEGSVFVTRERRRLGEYEKAQALKSKGSVGDLKQAGALFAKLGAYRDAPDQALECEALRKKKTGRLTKVIGIGAGVVIIAVLLVFLLIIPMNKLNQGKTALESGEYVAAGNLFIEANGFGESRDLLVECANTAAENGDFAHAALFFEKSGDSSKANYYYGREALDADENESAKNYFLASSEPDCEIYLETIGYRFSMIEADSLFTDKKYEEALAIYQSLPSTCIYRGVCAGDRASAIAKWIDVVRNFKTSLRSTDGVRIVRQTSKSSGSWNQWTGEYSNSATMSFLINDDGSAKISGSVSFYVYTSYSSISAGVGSAELSRSFSTTVYNDPTFTLCPGDYTTITFDGETLTLDYDKFVSNEDVYFNQRYTSTATYN